MPPLAASSRFRDVIAINFFMHSIIIYGLQEKSHKLVVCKLNFFHLFFPSSSWTSRTIQIMNIPHGTGKNVP